jgi:hypothetical protein
MALLDGQALNVYQWVGLFLWMIFMVYFEGYRGFHKAFSPRVVLRLHVLAQHPTVTSALLAPLVGMGLIRATRKRLIVSWSVIGMIVMLVFSVSKLDYPYRAIIDLGVVAGLLVGSISLTYHYIRSFKGHFPDMPSDMV